ncbi:hypothetical protein ABNB59_15570 [Paenibacillus larvae]|uniref:Uncharacterized protein n=3 Tax=Paenibacillus larvae TaxID=1464 RepID=A0AAP5JPU6_9BACL|nr:hypothetical protein [Paenibacillus larvae]MCY7490104.1 hypothetical protein [Paenibacillus larvae]MCY9561727.1 hypothetical protein [Paenibacillus larvae]MCY9566160.1 hypothetical protein [Paenibacillus larvae]MCY9573876.1 hypothetical protein [Paenibacillus larvae]MCY9700406.1 hypothetical protein [Paenibacillus larvae]
MMPTYLDAQISQNSGSFGAPLASVTTTPALFGTLGLITAGAGANLRVQFEATVTISAIVDVLSSVIIQIVRGVGGPGVGTTVYTAIHTLPILGVGVLSTDVITIAGADFLPPNPVFLTYQAFVSVTGIALATRVGPESFNALAVSD